jgi:hypothetical protein
VCGHLCLDPICQPHYPCDNANRAALIPRRAWVWHDYKGQHMFTSTTIRSALALTLSLGSMTAEAATVVSSVHYQKYFPLSCGGTQCSVRLPAPGVKRRLNVTRITCGFNGTGTPSVSQIVLENASNVAVLVDYLPADYSVSGSHMLNQAVDIQVGATQHIAVFLGLVTGTLSGAFCTATGTLDTLQ